MWSNIAEKWKAFSEWQQRPSRVPTMTEGHHRCFTCGQEYQGNYCPCCGQSAKIGRYSFKKAFLLFLDVWGLGNRGMFRTIRDLMLRPGYMIRDYISGMQMAYFPPFKLLFLLTALYLVVDSGLKMEFDSFWGTATEQTSKTSAAPSAKEEVAQQEPAEEKPNGGTFGRIGAKIGIIVDDFNEKYPNFTTLSMLLVMAVFIYFLVRKSPNIPDLRFSELIVALVYMWDMYYIYFMVFKILCVPDGLHEALYLLPIIPLKQMTGFTWWRTILVILLSYLYALILFIILLLVGYYIWEAA